MASFANFSASPRDVASGLGVSFGIRRSAGRNHQDTIVSRRMRRTLPYNRTCKSLLGADRRAQTKGNRFEQFSSNEKRSVRRSSTASANFPAS